MVRHAPCVKPDTAKRISSIKISRPFRVIGALLLIVLLVLLRVVWLDSDAYSRLSWSSALLTDEGFYLHNARNLVLFGHARTDDFNNALIMPLLHVVQVVVFRVVGVGVVQGRGISVVCSLLTLFVFFCTLCRAFSPRVAWLGVVLLGLDPVFTLYNRLALMDTPACLPLVCAFYAWVRAAERKEEEKKRGREEEKKEINGEAGWLVVCGACLGLAYTVRGLAAVVLPVPFLLLLLPVLGWWQHEYAQRKEGERLQAPRAFSSLLLFFSSSLLPFLLGLTLVLGVYLLVWYLPHRQEIAQVNAYYLHHQLLPDSLHTLRTNLLTALLKPRGVIPFLLKHSPIVFLLGCAGMLQNTQEQEQAQSGRRYMAGWFCLLLLFVSTVDYAPSRYYVLFYPALTGLAALRLDAMLSLAAQQRVRRSLTGAIALIVIIWGGANVYWYADWVTHITYRQRDADRWLAAHLPPNSILIGAVAPGLCLNNRFRCVPVIEDLCNDNAPVERYANSPCYILILDGTYDGVNNGKVNDGKGVSPSAVQIARAERWKERWWMRHYPDLVKPQTRLHEFSAMLRPFFTIGVYAVPRQWVKSGLKARPDSHTGSTFFKPEQD